MEKNTVLAIVLSSLVLIGFMFLQTYLNPTIEYLPEDDAIMSIDSNQTLTNEVLTEINIENHNQIAQIEDFEEIVSINEEIIKISTSKANILLSNRGGDIVGFELKDHLDGDKGVEMADSISEINRAFSLSLGSYNGQIINDLFQVKKISDYSYGFYKKMHLAKADGSIDSFTLIKEYHFDPEDYLFKLDIIIDSLENSNSNYADLNLNGKAYTLRTSPQIGPYYDKKKDRYENRTFMSYTNDKRKKQILSDNTTKEYTNSYTWTGLAGKYFTILVHPQSPETMGQVLYSTRIEQNNYTNAQVFLTRNAISQKSNKDTYYIYVGPRTDKDLKKYNILSDNNWDLSNLRFDDSLQSSGILSWLEIFMKAIMQVFYKIIPNWGVSIILMTILLKVALFPLTKKSSLSTLKMQEIQPQMKEIQDKYKGNPEKLNIELAKLYKETGYNPMMGCLPLLIQFPLIIAMFNLFNNYFEFRGAMFIPGWIPDLSQGDSLYVLGFSIPLLGNHLRILPVIYVISQLLFGKITQSSASAGANATQMKIMTMGMPLFFFFIFYNAPAGLLLYWTISNLLQLVQQVLINKTMKEKREALEGNVMPMVGAKKKK